MTPTIVDDSFNQCSGVLRSRGQELDTSPSALGRLIESPSRSADQADLLKALNHHGYLFLRDMFPREKVLDVRKEICHAMNKLELLKPSSDPLDCIPPALKSNNDSSQGSSTLDSIPDHCPAMRELLYGSETRSFFKKLLGGEVLHFDLTWFRGVGPGFGTVPHCDIVYMGRGTQDLLTFWVPYGDIPLKMGGLMVLENSMNTSVQRRIEKYLVRDVDEYCENRPLPEHVDLNAATDNKVWNGWLAANPVSLRKNLGGRWLTSDYRAGDALIFSSKLVHASLDNQSRSFRLSSDCRYQLADQPVDQRFVGNGPLGHTGAAKRGRVC